MKTKSLIKIIKKSAVYLLAALFYSLIIFFFTNSISEFILFLMGALMGVGYAIIDEEYLYTLYQDDENKEKKFYVSQSSLYMLSLVPTSIFVFTSSGSFMAMGLMGGLILFFLVEMSKQLNSPELFFSKFLSLAEVDRSRENLQKILIGSILFFVILHFLVLL
jgi:hypothetical protein